MPTHYHPNAAPRADSGNGGKIAAGCGIGCLVAAIVAVVITVGGVLWGVSYIKKLPEKFTDDQPIVIESYEPSSIEAASVQAKFDDFRNALANGKPADPLILTTEEVNTLIASHPDFSEIDGKARIEFIGDTLQADVSVPIEGVNELVDGRYFNGRASIKFHYLNGATTYDVESIEVNGTKLSKMMITGFIEGMNDNDPLNNPEFNAMKSIIEEIAIENGVLKIVPKPLSSRGH